MKIMWLIPECPYPANTGGRVVTWNRIKEIGKKNNIYLFVMADNQEELSCKREIEKICTEVRFYIRHKSISVLFKSAFFPYTAASRWNERMKADIDACYEKVRPDLIMVEFPQMLGNLPKTVKKNARIVLNQHNIEHLSMKSIADHADNIFGRAVCRIVAWQMKHYEHVQYKKYPISLYTFVSETDKEYFETEYGLQNTLLVPIGADVQDIGPVTYTKTLAFIAKMSYEPNEAGAIWFIENVWSQIISRIADAELFLVGKDPTEKLKGCCQKYAGITVTGTVDDVEPYYKKSTAVIVPIFSGGGVKVKLLEGLGHGKIVITTNKGIEGTKFVGGKHVLAADSADEFAGLCVAALEQPEQFEPLRTEANNMMKAQYSWIGIMDGFERQLRRMCENESTRKNDL